MRNVIYTIVVSLLLYGCKSAPAATGGDQPQELPVVAITTQDASVYREFNASIEGTKNIDVRPQVDGYLEKIYVEEGAHVSKGQLLFKIDDKPYQEQLRNANASLLAAKANMENARINFDKLTPLLEHNLVSNVQVQSAKAAYDAAKASVAQAEAVVSNARINLGYTNITAEVEGYIGRIPYKPGSLVGRSSPDPLTVLSEIQNMYAYFSLSENDFIKFKEQFDGNTIEEKIKHMPAVELVLADNTVYPSKGTVELAEGQFNRTMGTISFRAVFPNTNGLLRSGNTGRIRVAQKMSAALVVPQEATYEIQDKIFVFRVADSNKVISEPINVSGKAGNYYLVDKGIKSGDKIVLAGLDRLRDGAAIKPMEISTDSLLRANPL